MSNSIKKPADSCSAGFFFIPFATTYSQCLASIGYFHMSFGNLLTVIFKFGDIDVFAYLPIFRVLCLRFGFTVFNRYTVILNTVYTKFISLYIFTILFDHSIRFYSIMHPFVDIRKIQAFCSQNFERISVTQGVYIPDQCV